MSYRTSYGKLVFGAHDLARMIDHLDRLNAAMQTIVEWIVEDQAVPAGVFLDAVMDNQLEIHAFKPGSDWYHIAPDEVEIALAQGRLSEPMAAYYLNCTIVELRLRMEKAFGNRWRDLADLDLTHNALTALRKIYQSVSGILLINIAERDGQALLNAGLVVEVVREPNGTRYKLVPGNPAKTTQYIIIKASRSPEIAHLSDAYSGPAARELNIAGKVYENIDEAVADADRLTELNPVGFEVWAIGSKRPIYPRRLYPRASE
jgi:hypothetical protein